MRREAFAKSRSWEEVRVRPSRGKDRLICPRNIRAAELELGVPRSAEFQFAKPSAEENFCGPSIQNTLLRVELEVVKVQVSPSGAGLLVSYASREEKRRPRLSSANPAGKRRSPSLLPLAVHRRPAWIASMKNPPRVFVAALACLIFPVLTLSASAANWPQYRGPNASGVDDSVALPTRWNIETGENIRWQSSIPGLAHASPIVWGDRVYVATAVQAGGDSPLKVGLYGNIDSVKEKESNQWRLLALDKATGKVLWNTLGHEAVPKVARHTKGTHCNSTPATDGRRIVALFGSEGLFCFDISGKLLWKKDLGPMDSGYFQMRTAQWGFASSPVIHEGKVIVQCDVQKDSFLAAFDVDTGKEIWRTARSDVPTWSTPTIVSTRGRTQIAVNGWHHSGGYDFATGQELWKYDGGGDIPVPTPISAHGLIYFTSAHGRSRPMRAVTVDAVGDISPSDTGKTHPSIAWQQEKRGNYMQTPVVVGGLLFGCADVGLLTCFDARTGEIRYSERVSKTSEGYTASPVSDGRHLYITSELGNVFVVPATRTFSVVAANTLGETCLATPAIAEGTLFFRTRDKLIAVSAKR
jgi:outer membrane protein assembly factor BamB